MPTTIPGTLILQSPAANDPLLDLNTQPSLDLQFATSKTLDDRVSGLPLVDHQRDASGSNSPGTYVGSDGLIKTSTVNLFTYSEEFDNAVWTKNGSTVAANQVTAPNGTFTADKLIASTNFNSTNNRIYRLVNSGKTLSVFAKSAETDAILLRSGNGSIASDYVIFNLSNGSATPSGTAYESYGSESVGNGWYRVWVTSDQSYTNAYFGVAGSNVAANNGIYVWGAQLEEGTTATDYIPTTSTISGAPRFDHDPATGESLGLLIEESRTNLLTYSEEFDQSVWGKLSGGTGAVALVSPNIGPAPDGSITADRLVCDLGGGTTSSDYSMLQRSTTFTGNDTGSVYIKSNTGSSQQVYLRVGVTETSVTATTSWQRLSLTEGSYTGGANFTIGTRGTKGSDDSIDILIWGAQLEEGSFPTSYIPTTTSTVTRAADVAEITGTNFSRWYNQSEGTAFSDVTAYSGSQWRAGLVMDTALGTGTRLQILHEESQDRLFSGASFKVITPNVPTGQQFKSVWSTDGTSVFAASNGSSVVTLAQAPAQAMNALGVGSILGVAGNFGDGHISRLTYYPYRLGDTTLQEITS